MKSVVSHPVLGEVTLVCSRRSRRISIAVKPDGSVRLAFPPAVTQRRAVEFLESRIGWITAARERFAAAGRSVQPRTAAEIGLLRRKAQAELPAKVEYWAQRFGFTYGRVTIRAARTKWGSCSARNDISLSLFMAALPSHLQDFVIIHELCHTLHHNHSGQFHALVDRCTGGREKELQRELRNYRTL